MRGARARTTLLWGVIAVALVLSAAGLTVSIAVDGDHTVVDALLGVAVVGLFDVTGAVVVAARPRHPIGWLLLWGGTAWSVSNAAIDAGTYGLSHPGTLHAVSALLLVGGVIRDVGWFSLILGLPIFFPTGRIASLRWRWLPRLLVVVNVAAVANTLLAPDADLGLTGWHNPLAPSGILRVLEPVSFFLSIPLALVLVVLALLQLRERWRRGTPLERQQIRIVAVTAGLPILAAPLAFIPGLPGDPFSVLVLPLPVSIGFAVLARRLYDLRTAANRTAVWILLSALVAGIYALVIAALGGVLDTGTVAWLPAVAVGVVAVSFAPLRDLLQRGVDRVLFGRWQEPYEVLARLGQRLEATADIDRLLQEATTELAALGLRRVRIENAHGHVLAAAADDLGSTDPAQDEQIPLLVYGERVGTLRFDQPATRLRPADRRLLEDLAVHLGGVLHDHRLTQDLQRALERVVLAREEERRRLRRDLHDGLGPALAGHLLRLDVIAREVDPDGHAAQLVRALREELRATVLDVRRVVEGLRPPALDELGLAGAVEQSVHRLTAGTGMRVEVEVAPLPPLPAAAEVAAFRIITEAVTNVVRHAEAGWCRVTLEPAAGLLRLVVEDDGVGIGPSRSAGNGLHTMRERAEEMRGSVIVTCERGTRVVAELPVPTPTPAPAPTPTSTPPLPSVAEVVAS
ncbi:MAG TPA: histidine kinase [Nocardioides sp.]|uniref:sensor histidine kinase n=1 Tax=Nocardioides sp. TaxID=35761 RepID=UPI002F4240A8